MSHKVQTAVKLLALGCAQTDIYGTQMDIYGTWMDIHASQIYVVLVDKAVGAQMCSDRYIWHSDGYIWCSDGYI